MFITFILSLFVLFLPAAVFSLSRTFRQKAGWIPLSLVLQFFIVAIIAGFLPLPYGALRLVVTLIAGTVFTLAICFLSRKGLPPAFFKQWKLCLLLAFVCNLDSFVIYARQGWQFQDWDSYLKTNYFRAPFNNDVQRNVDLVETILRRSDNSPFLPNSALRYQILWHQFAATMVAPFEVSVTRYPLVAGVTLASSFTFFFLLFWLLLLRASQLKRGELCLLAVLVGTHAEIYNMILSLIRTQHLGIEADWSLSFPIYYRNMSVKFLSLISPQHLLFFLIAILYFSPLWDAFGKKMRAFLLFLGLLATPILSLLLVTAESFRAIQQRRWPSSLLWSLVLAYFLYPWVMGFGVMTLLKPERVESMGFLQLNPRHLFDVPFLLVAYTGVLGLVITLNLKKARHSFEGLFVLAGVFIFSFLITSGELRRHFAMMAAFLCCLLLPSLIRWNRIFQIAAVLALLLHGYFLYGFTLAPGGVDLQIVWSDYFEMNRIIRTRFPEEPVLGATSSAAGIEFPIVMEATISYDGMPGAVVHGKTNEDQRILMGRAEQEGILPLAHRLGYRAVTWGPLEEKVWGRGQLERYCDRLLAESGSVSLFSLKENPFEEGGIAGLSPHLFGQNLRNLVGGQNVAD